MITAHGVHGPTAVVVGMEANGLGVARSLAQHSIDTIGLGMPAWRAEYATRSCRVIRCAEWSRKTLIEELVALGRRLEGKAPLLITKDEPVLWISDYRDALSEWYEITLPDHDTVHRLMNKIRFLQTSLDEGWPVPKTWIVRKRVELMDRLAEIPLPCILKPAVRNSEFRRNAPHKAFKVATRNELVEAYDLVATWESEVVIQEWVEGEDDRIAYCLAYYNREGRPLALFPGRKLRQYPIDCGNTAIAAPVPNAWAEPILCLTRRIFERVGFRGLGSIEYKMRADDEPVIMEPTVGRTNYQNEIAVLNGVNIPAIAYFDLVGQDARHPRVTVRPCKLVDGEAEFRAFLELRRAGRLTLRRWLMDRSGRKRYMMLRLADPAPFLAAAGTNLLRRLRGAVRFSLRAARRSLAART